MEDRPHPEELLREYDLASGPREGKLKIFFGYAAGVGKTYAMLEAAHRAQTAGVDVAVGYVEPHTRPDTLRLLDGLEQLPPKQIAYRGITLREFDLDAALRRKPQLLLVDELAHTNAEGCRHSKRYQDVQELLHAGIDVYTTVNVQHLESLNDLVSSITGVAVQERVPDWVFDQAAQVEVVDIEPDDLVARLEEGKIYREAQAQKALSAFFSKKNLAALREIALRRTADRLNRTALKTPGGANAGEQIMICLSSSPSNAKVIRTAARMCEALQGRFTALFVETSQFAHMSEDSRSRLRQNLKLAEDLGAQIATVYGDDIAVQIAEYAKVSGVTKLVLGRTNHRHDLFSPRRGMIDKLTQLAPNLDIYIIPDRRPEYRPGSRWQYLGSNPAWKLRPIDLARGFLLVAAATVAGLAAYRVGFSEANVITLYLLAVLGAAAWSTSTLSGILVSLASMLSFNFFFTEPRFTFFADAPSYPVTFAIMLVASCLTSSLVTRIQRQGHTAAEKAYRTDVLLETSQQLQNQESAADILTATAHQLQKLLERPILFYTAGSGEHLGAPICFALPGQAFPMDGLTQEEKGVAEWVYKNNKHAGATTNTLPSAKCLYLAVRGRDRALAVAGVYMPEDRRELDAFSKNLLIAVLAECGLALEKQTLQEAKKAMELQAQQEQLRANLLRAISHDLRTPLTSISGAANMLMEQSAALEETKKQTLYADIYDDAQWLVSLVENLLSITRIENDAVSLDLQPELLDDVFREALAHLDRHAAEHTIRTELADDMLMARMDARLIVQVIINLVNNAIRYTPPGSEIVVSAAAQGDRVRVSVQDDGPGIAAEDKKHLFEMFYTTGGTRTDSRRGLGLGLSLCRSIVEAHGGSIQAADAVPHGTVFQFALQKAEVSACG